MTWNRRYVIKSYIRASLWLVPFFAVVLYMVVNRITYGIDGWLLRTGQIDEKTAFFGLTMVGARSALDTIVTLNLSFLVFTFGSLLVAIQVAGGQYTPRIIATTLLRDNAIRFTVGYFVFTLLFAVRVLTRMGGEIVHQFNTFIAGVLGLVSIVVFLYLIDYAARFLRPVSIVQRVGESGIAVIKSVYPESTTRPRSVETSRRPASPDRTVANAGASGIVLAVDLDGLVAQARNANGIIEFVPQVGDFVAVDEPLFRLYGGAGAIDDRQLRAAVALGSERTIEQDPTFAFRILVDIAIKALSPAINDPTTAVLAIDQLHRLLRLVGLRQLQQRGDLRCGRRTAARFQDAELGGLCAPHLHRDTSLRRGQHPDHAADAFDAGKSHANSAAASSCRVAPATGAFGSHDRGAILVSRRPGAGPDPGSAGVGGIVGRASRNRGANRRRRRTRQVRAVRHA